MLGDGVSTPATAQSPLSAALTRTVATMDGVGRGRVDDRSRIEHLLLMSGVESHPGPSDKYFHEPLTTLTHDNVQWVFDAAYWTSKGGAYSDRTRALLRFFKPGSMPFRRIAKLASEVKQEQATGIQKWQSLQTRVKELLPQNPLTQQDYLARMKRRPEEPWADFFDRYLLYAETCDEVSARIKAVEL